MGLPAAAALDHAGLQGHWVSPCIQNGTSSDQVGVIEYRINDSTLTAVYKVYWAPDRGVADNHLWTDSLVATLGIVDILGYPELYPKLADVLTMDTFESPRMKDKAENLRALLEQWRSEATPLHTNASDSHRTEE